MLIIWCFLSQIFHFPSKSLVFRPKLFDHSTLQQLHEKKAFLQFGWGSCAIKCNLIWNIFWSFFGEFTKFTLCHYWISLGVVTWLEWLNCSLWNGFCASWVLIWFGYSLYGHWYAVKCRNIHFTFNLVNISRLLKVKEFEGSWIKVLTH